MGMSDEGFPFGNKLASEEHVPVCRRDRFILVTAAAMLVATVGLDARAQSQNFDLRGEDGTPLQTGPDAGSIPNGVGTSAGNDNNSGNSAATNAGSPNPYGPNGANTALPPRNVSNGGTLSSDHPPSPDAPTAPTNYGRPKPKKPKLYQLFKLKKYGNPLLPPLTVYKTAPGVPKNATQPPPADPQGPNPPPTVAVIPTIAAPPKPKREANPYDALGIDYGTLRLFPYIEADSGYDSNPNRQSADVVGSSYVHGETGFKLQSLWSQNSLGGELHAGYYDYLQEMTANRPDVSGTLTGRVDVTNTTKINLESRLGVSAQLPGSANLAIPGSVYITNRPLIANLGQTIGASQQFNRLTLDLRGTFDRYIFGDATQSDGTDLFLSLDNYNDYGLTGRASYELSPGFIPFVEVRGDELHYDNTFDIDGYARSSSGILGRAGTKVDLASLLTGEVSAGYASRDYADPRLPPIAAPTADASLIYTPTPLTKLTLTMATDLYETTLAGASGAVTRRLTGKVEHELLRNLTLNGTASYQVNQYQGAPLVEQLYSFGIGADYSLTRSIVIRGSFTHERLSSNSAGDDYTANVFLVGLKLQQ